MNAFISSLHVLRWNLRRQFLAHGCFAGLALWSFLQTSPASVIALIILLLAVTLLLDSAVSYSLRGKKRRWHVLPIPWPSVCGALLFQGLLLAAPLFIGWGRFCEASRFSNFWSGICVILLSVCCIVPCIGLLASSAKKLTDFWLVPGAFLLLLALWILLKFFGSGAPLWASLLLSLLWFTLRVPRLGVALVLVVGGAAVLCRPPLRSGIFGFFVPGRPMEEPLSLVQQKDESPAGYWKRFEKLRHEGHPIRSYLSDHLELSGNVSLSQGSQTVEVQTQKLYALDAETRGYNFYPTVPRPKNRLKGSYSQDTIYSTISATKLSPLTKITLSNPRISVPSGFLQLLGLKREGNLMNLELAHCTSYPLLESFNTSSEAMAPILRVHLPSRKCVLPVRFRASAEGLFHPLLSRERILGSCALPEAEQALGGALTDADLATAEVLVMPIKSFKILCQARAAKMPISELIELLRTLDAEDGFVADPSFTSLVLRRYLDMEIVAFAKEMLLLAQKGNVDWEIGIEDLMKLVDLMLKDKQEHLVPSLLKHLKLGWSRYDHEDLPQSFLQNLSTGGLGGGAGPVMVDIWRKAVRSEALAYGDEIVLTLALARVGYLDAFHRYVRGVIVQKWPMEAILELIDVEGRESIAGNFVPWMREHRARLRWDSEKAKYVVIHQ